MAFEELNGARSARGKLPETGVYLGVYAKQKGEAPSVAFRFQPDVMERLGWSIGDKVELLQGTGPDAGYILIRKPRSPGVATYTLRNPGGINSANGAAIAIQSTRIDKYVVPNEGRASIAVTYQAFNGELTVMLPVYIKAKE